MSFDRKLAGYVAAAAASVATAQSADAKLIVRSGSALGEGDTVNIDFDQVAPEEYWIGQIANPNRVALLKNGNALSTNAYLTTTNALPAALTAGTLIAPSPNFASSYDAVLATAGGGDGNFSVDEIVGNTQYVGVRFQFAEGGPTYYGWIGVDITNSTFASGVITEYAYEDSGGSIVAGVVPEPAGLALLAFGAPFLLRRKHA